MSAESNPTSKSERSCSEEFSAENPFTDPVIASQWARSVEGEQGLWRDEILYPAVQNWLDSLNSGSNAVIADIGSGQGRLSAEMSGYGQYIGIEPSSFLTERARDLYPAPNRDFVIGNAYAIPLPDSSVDGIVSINVWFHLSNLNRAAAELARVLKREGSFFISTADNDSLATWKTFYTNPSIDTEKMQGEVRVPVNNLSSNTFYFQPNENVLELLRENGLVITSVTKSLTVDGATLFLLIEGVKS